MFAHEDSIPRSRLSLPVVESDLVLTLIIFFSCAQVHRNVGHTLLITMSDYDEKRASDPQFAHNEKEHEPTREVHATSVALAAAVEKRPPKLWSTNMLKLYGILGIGYLISTMNGFGTCANLPLQDSDWN